MKKSILFFLSVFFCCNSSAQKYELLSPDRKLKAEIEINRGISADLKRNEARIVKLSNLELETGCITQSGFRYKIKKTNRESVNEIVRPEIREKASELVNAYNELEIRFRADYSVTFRLFNEGLAYRFTTFSKDSLIIKKENLEISLGENDSARFQSSKSFNSSYETPYEHKKLNDIEQGQLCNLPFLVQKQDGSFVMITEADLYNYPGLWLRGTAGEHLEAANPPFPEAFSSTGNAYVQGQVSETSDYIASVSGTRTYPWRIFAIAGAEEGLVSNSMVYLLATPCAIEDPSWIRPGVVMFDWWAKHNIYGVDFRSGINTETAKYFIDFCAKHGFRYFLFDDGWCPRDNLLEPVPGLNMEEVTAYASSKGVDIMLWVIWRTLEKQWAEAFSLFESWGIKGIKVDFMNRDDQVMVEFYERVARMAGEKKMVVNFHGAYKPCGLRRKYPNVLTREGLIEYEYNGWTDEADPEHHNLLPYIRMFAGPMDYIPGSMRNSTKDNFRAVGDYPMEQGTRAHSMALFVILNSPMTMLPDSPSDYYREKECAGFLTKIPVEWDETRLLKGKIAEYTVIARRSGDNWYIGAITNWNSREIDLDTKFLNPGKYRIEAITDGINSDKRAEDYRKIQMECEAGDILKLRLASGGGWVAEITPVR
ncbi:MAG TPA: glycoside hydrolase family 97 protein [Bacteroidales bacterium]|nr:glycoside hydrolase family 97 protein [Bacteroidales bacterium]HOS72079.1 glycoside hydrolase family 97 protein [Bacteroidales bacterium]HQH23195.1 glycoside hydrolase family 97 protein [Bacteroidales bacterium]HQJ80947.1 glycoside hydrolase family 97 protein [Bacteroidales bacterium]